MSLNQAVQKSLLKLKEEYEKGKTVSFHVFGSLTSGLLTKIQKRKERVIRFLGKRRNRVLPTLCGSRPARAIKKCPKCGGEMERGNMRGYGGAELKFASSESKTYLVFSKTNSSVTYSCKVCGYIEMYRKLSEE